MSNELFLASVKKLTEQNLPLAELIGTAETLKTAGELPLVQQLYSLWIQLNNGNPLLHVAHFNYAVMLSDAGDLQAAKDSLDAALKLSPDFAPAYINLGSVLERMGKTGEAVNCWTELANKLGAVNGQSVNYKLTALKQIGRVLEMHKLQPNAEAALKQSLEISVHQQDVVQHYVALRLAQCEWPVVQPLEGVNAKTLRSGTGPLSMAIYTDDPVMQMAAGWHYAKSFIGWPEQDMRDLAREQQQAARKGKRRIGYISSDLRNHAVGFIMAEVFELHNRDEFEVYAYYCGIPLEDTLKDRIRGTVDQWVDLNGLNDAQAAQRIIDDGIDILVDVNGYTKDARTGVFALRPAPINVNWLGFPGTMGTPYHHYIIADDWIIPPAHEKYFTEKVVRLPCYQPNDRKRVVDAHQPTRAEVGLPEEGIVFCSFNGLQKISRFTFLRWMEILKRVPNSVLWLLDGGETNERLRGYAKEQGVDPSRLVFAEKKNNPQHLARYPLADLFLDNQPYGAHVTASDALWMGVPIITLAGRGFAARVCGSLVRAAGVPELICESQEAFIERAVALANDKAEIARLKKKLADNREQCVLFDTPGLMKELEKLYHGMWKDFVGGKLPQPDLTNMDVYHQVGSTLDHEAEEMLRVPDYENLYREKLARKHRYYPLPADNRLWTTDDIHAAETGDVAEESSSVVKLFKKKR